MTQSPGRSLYYAGMAVDFSRPSPVDTKIGDSLIQQAEKFTTLMADQMPSFDVVNEEQRKQIEAENREWWPAHCEVFRRKRIDLLGKEYSRSQQLVYFCQDGPFYGMETGASTAATWWKLMTDPSVTGAWPVVMFHGEVVYFEWSCVRNDTGETTCDGNVTALRRGHAGGVHLMTEKLAFYRNVNLKFLQS